MADASTVYGARLKGWWFQTISPGATWTWTASAGTNLTQATSGNQPASGTTPLAIVDAVCGAARYASASFTPSGSPTAMHVSAAILIPTTSTTETFVYWLIQSSGQSNVRVSVVFFSGTYTISVDALGGGAGGSQIQATITTGWHEITLERSTTGVMTLYVDGSSVGSQSDWNTWVPSAISGMIVGNFGGTNNVEICSPCIATDTTNFSSGDRSSIYSALRAYVEPTYKLTSATGTFSMSGQAATLKSARKLVAGQGTTSLAGQAASLKVGRKVVAAIGTFALSGQAAALKSARRLVLSQGTYSASGQSAGLLSGRKCVAAQGAVVLAGQAASLRVGRILPLSAGVVALTGQPASLRQARKLVVAQGTIVLTGNAALFATARKLTSATGSIALSGQSATLVYTPITGFTLAASLRLFGLAGQLASLRSARIISASRGTFALAGQPSLSAVAHRLLASSGHLTLVGFAAVLDAPNRHSAASITVFGLKATTIDIRGLRATQIRILRGTPMSLHVGDDYLIPFEIINNETGDYEDPTSLSVYVQGPVSARTYVYGVDAEVTRTTVGRFKIRVPITAAGRWIAVVNSPGPVAKGREDIGFTASGTIADTVLAP